MRQVPGGGVAQGVRRAALVVQVDQQTLAYELDGGDATIEVTVTSRREEDDRLDWLGEPTWRLLPDLRELDISITSRMRAGAARHYLMRWLPSWPELTGDPRCPARLMPALGLELRCERWHGHVLDGGPGAHAAGVTTWHDFDPRRLASRRSAA